MTRPSHRLAVRLGRGVALPLLRSAFRLRVEGSHHLPPGGPALLAANHLSFLDPVVLQSAFPRPIHYLMTARLHRDRRWQWFFRLMDTVPVSMSSGNFLALKLAAERLQAGEVVGVFPEGGISKDGTLGPFRPGVALLAMRTGVPIVPVRIEGTRQALPPGSWRPRRTALRVCVGAPIPLPVASEAAASPGAAAEWAERIREAVASLPSI